MLLLNSEYTSLNSNDLYERVLYLTEQSAEKKTEMSHFSNKVLYISYYEILFRKFTVMVLIAWFCNPVNPTLSLFPIK